MVVSAFFCSQKLFDGFGFMFIQFFSKNLKSKFILDIVKCLLCQLSLWILMKEILDFVLMTFLNLSLCFLSLQVRKSSIKLALQNLLWKLISPDSAPIIC